MTYKITQKNQMMNELGTRQLELRVEFLTSGTIKKLLNIYDGCYLDGDAREIIFYIK